MNKEELEEIMDMLGQEEKKEENASDSKLADSLKSLWRKRKSYYISIPIAFVIAVLLALSMPKYYIVQVKLAPEMSNAAGASSGLSSIMKNLGMSRAANTGEADAILPNLYPDLMNSQLFLVSLFDIPVVNRDGTINTTYYDYLNKHQKYPWWNKVIGAVMSLIPDFGSEPGTKAKQANSNGKVNPAVLNKRQTMIAKAIAQNVGCSVDKKTYVISIAVKAQDPLICATVADSACQRLQGFITEYRTKKARIEYEHMQEQYETARQEYEDAKKAVQEYNDANWDLVEEEFVVEKQSLQNEMQLRFSALSSINTQLLAARSKLDEARPVFTVLDGASVPLKPAGPKQKRFVLGFVLMVCICQTLWLLAKEALSAKKSK